MATVETTPRADGLSAFEAGIERLEVRTGGMLVTLKEIETGALIVVATPAAGFELTTDALTQGVTYRVTIRARETAGSMPPC